MEAIALTGGFSRLKHLNHNERVLQDIKGQLADAYHDFLVCFSRSSRFIVVLNCISFQAASALRLEVQQRHLTMQQTQLATQQAEIQMEVARASAVTVSSSIYVE